jgi:hypothetical protein
MQVVGYLMAKSFVVSEVNSESEQRAQPVKAEEESEINFSFGLRNTTFMKSSQAAARSVFGVKTFL